MESLWDSKNLVRDLWVIERIRNHAVEDTVPHAKCAKDAKGLSLLVANTQPPNDVFVRGRAFIPLTSSFAPLADFA